MSTINAYAAPDANVIFGAAYDDSLGENIRVTVVATGLPHPNTKRQLITVLQGGLRTGTDNRARPMSMQTPVAGLGSMDTGLAAGSPSSTHHGSMSVSG